MAVAAIAVPVVGAATLLLADRTTVAENAIVMGLTVAGAGVVIAVLGYIVGRRSGAVAMPIIGGLTSLCVAIGILIVLSLV